MVQRNRKTNYLPLILAAAIAVIAALTVILILAGKNRNSSLQSDEPATRRHVTPEEFRGVYVPSVYNLTFPSRADLPEKDLKEEIDGIVSKAKELGLNTVCLQVRPCCDALYKSEIFPVSEYLSSSGELTLDCLSYLVEKAHAQEIAVFAWINPLRISVSNLTADELPDSSPAKSGLRDCVVSYGGKLYFDPARPEVRSLICRGVAEIVSSYEVDGVIFDDYFYPYKVWETGDDGVSVAAIFDDGDSYKAYAAEGESLEDFRRGNINTLVKEVYGTVKKADPGCLFGVASFGIWQNDDGKNGGSLTSGLESYDELYCDTLAWCEGGYVDFIAPQIYWKTSDLQASFKVLSTWWNEKLKDTGVELLISHAAFRYTDGDFDAGEMTKQIEYASALSEYKGSLFYSYAVFRDDAQDICAEIKGYYTK